MSCGACRFWKPTVAQFGACRRRSPGMTDLGGTKWPTTVRHDSCGDFKAREATAVPQPPEGPALRQIREHGEPPQRFTAPPVVVSEEVSLPRGWLSDIVARVMGVRCAHPNGFEVQLRVDGTARCPHCSAPQQEASA